MQQLLSAYPIDMSRVTLLNAEEEGSEHQDPRAIVRYALVLWNQYVTANDAKSLNDFMAQVHWLVQRKRDIGERASGWPIYQSRPEYHTRGPWLSAVVQGCGLSILVRAYQVTHDLVLPNIIDRVAQTFNKDILDGGVRSPVGDEGTFFEEVAVYPASHILTGFIFALFGLYDYIALTNNAHFKQLLVRSHATMHQLLDEFDCGFWTYPDLITNRLASLSELTLQSMLLETLAFYSGCDCCSLFAQRWRKYRGSIISRLYHYIASGLHACRLSLRQRLWNVFHSAALPSRPEPVCIAVPMFPHLGGIMTVMKDIDLIMKDTWRIEYLTQRVGLHQERFVIHQFGTARMSPWNFPLVWFYVICGFAKCLSLMWHGAGYRVILPQDATFTGAYAALAAKLAGIRTVCIDHGALTLLNAPNKAIYRSELTTVFTMKEWPQLLRSLARICLKFYFPSHALLARVSARLSDYFLFPGVKGDGVEEICKGLRIPVSRIRRYASMIDLDRFIMLDNDAKANVREKLGLSADATVIAIICRLSPEKGLDIALQSISRALVTLSPDVQARLRVLIVGDGPIRGQIEADIHAQNLEQTCLMLGEASPTEVLSILSVSNIFLYTATRGTGIPMAVLESMASCCAVIASTEPIANALLLAGGRGIAVSPGNVAQTSKALVQLINDPELCRDMGMLARGYVSAHHNPRNFRRVLLQATYWSDLDKLLEPKVATVL
jgi:glycosyltransferase involved in cell wall biosynthesis